jgi:hypothetical protein
MAQSIAPLFLSAAGTVVSSVGTLVSSEASAAAAKAAGKDAQRVANWQADQMTVNAGQERASSQREAIEERRRGRLALSRARAVAGASGAAGFEDIFADLETQGETNALTALWEGEERARGMETEAAATRYGGSEAKRAGAIQSKATRQAGLIGTVGTVLEGGSDFFTKYNDFQEPGYP